MICDEGQYKLCVPLKDRADVQRKLNNHCSTHCQYGCNPPGSDFIPPEEKVLEKNEEKFKPNSD